jgi:hypothetical protein
MEKKRIKIEELPKNDSLRAPDGYFDSMTSRLQGKLGEEKTSSSHATSLWGPLAIAASVIGLLCVVWFSFRGMQDPANAETQLAQVAVEDLQAYLAIDELEIEDLAILADDEFFEEADLLPASVETLEDEQLEDLFTDFKTLKEDTL